MPEQTVLQRQRQMANRHMGRGSASLARKEMQIQVIRRRHFIPIVRSKSKTRQSDCSRGVEDSELPTLGSSWHRAKSETDSPSNMASALLGRPLSCGDRICDRKQAYGKEGLAVTLSPGHSCSGREHRQQDRDADEVEKRVQGVKSTSSQLTSIS